MASTFISLPLEEATIIGPVAVTGPLTDAELRATPVDVSFASNGLTVPTYNEVSAVASGVLTVITTYTVPAVTKAFLQQILGTGTNIATYTVWINGSLVAKKYTYFTEFAADFVFATDMDSGLNLATGDVVQIKVLHNRPTVGDFNATIQTFEVL